MIKMSTHSSHLFRSNSIYLCFQYGRRSSHLGCGTPLGFDRLLPLSDPTPTTGNLDQPNEKLMAQQKVFLRHFLMNGHLSMFLQCPTPASGDRSHHQLLKLLQTFGPFFSDKIYLFYGALNGIPGL
jgi:hypothetical protein